MRKYVFLIFGLMLFPSFFLIFLFLNKKNTEQEYKKQIYVWVVYSPINMTDDNSYLLKAYESVLQEEGIPFISKSITGILSKQPKNIVRFVPAIILPDGISKSLPGDAKYWFENYVRFGGNLLVVYDAGTKDVKNYYREAPLFSNLTGVNYCLYETKKDNAYSIGNIKFKNEALSQMEIPPGKTINNFLSGYKYGILEYPVAINRVLSEKIKVLAEVIVNNKSYVGIAVNKYEKGNVLYVNLPLGSLKADADDLPLRAVLEYFLRYISKVPFLLNVPDGKGGLIINWHIDSVLDWDSLPMMIKKGYCSKYLVYSSHITAGDFLNKPGDGLGFDACGKGAKYVEMLRPYGITGSHGGWAHNWFARKLEKGEFSKEEITRYIQMNNNCLERILKYKIVEYSAPRGVFPQPENTKILEELGFVAYYYTGDSGAFPNRSFFNKKMISKKVYAFPVTPFGKNASFFEIWKDGISEKEVENWLISLVDFTINKKTIRLVYSHPYDIPLYPVAIKKFIKYAEKKVKNKELYVLPMYAFYSFLNRFMKTSFSFYIKGKKFVAVLKNEEGLRNITVAIPKRYCNSIENYSWQDKDYFYKVITDSTKEFVLKCDLKIGVVTHY